MISKKIENAAPNLKNYNSAIQYLADFYTYRKSIDPGFSYDSWAAEVGFKSRSFLKMLLTRKRKITLRVIGLLSKSLCLSASEKLLFEWLVAADQAETADQRSIYLEKIFEHHGSSRDYIEVLNYTEFLSSDVLPKLQVLLSFHDIEKSPRALGKILNLSAAETLAHLKCLQKLGLARFDEQWFSVQKSFRVPKNLGSPALEKYHNLALEEAIQAQKKPLDLRRFRSLLVALSPTDYDGLITDIESLISKVLSKYDSDSLSGKRLYKININAFPTTDLVLASENTTGLQHKSENNDTIESADLF